MSKMKSVIVGLRILGGGGRETKEGGFLDFGIDGFELFRFQVGGFKYQGDERAHVEQGSEKSS